LLDAPRVQLFGARLFFMSADVFSAFDVFRGGTENCARGGRAPDLNFVSALNPAGRFRFQPVAAKAHQDRATSATSAASRPPDEYGCSGPG
jgi:hypothetical protein